MIVRKRHQRPFGIKVVVIIQVLFTLFVILRLWLASMPDAVLSIDVNANLNTYQVIDVVIEIFSVVIAYGLWRLRRWAWLLLMITVGIQMFVGILTYLVGEPLYISMLVNVIVVFYLYQQDVQNTFRSKGDIDGRYSTAS